jgi:hypothetical protein
MLVILNEVFLRRARPSSLLRVFWDGRLQRWENILLRNWQKKTFFKSCLQVSQEKKTEPRFRVWFDRVEQRTDRKKMDSKVAKLFGRTGLPDGLFSNQKSQFGKNL